MIRRRLAQKFHELAELVRAAVEFLRGDDDDVFEERFCTCRTRPHVVGCPLYR